jgi:hypothetical protein
MYPSKVPNIYYSALSVRHKSKRLVAGMQLAEEILTEPDQWLTTSDTARTFGTGLC